jgi:hypothetical protein
VRQGVKRNDRAYPGRFATFTEPWYSRSNQPDYPKFQADALARARKDGAMGLKVLKTLGLYLRENLTTGSLVKIDDKRFDTMWEQCAALKMPVCIHIADPEAFFLPIDRFNERFEELNGCSVSEYNRQRLEAQRSGYNEAVGQELELESDDEDSLEKDFQFNGDLKVDYDTVKALQLRFAHEIKGIREAMDRAGEAFEEWLKEQENAEKRTKYDWDAAHQRFLAAKETKAFLKAAQKFLSSGLPQELMAVMLPLQNTFGFWEDDLYTLTIPRSGVGYSLANWYEVFGDEFLEQYMGSEDSPNYDDVPMELLDQIAWELTFQMQDAYTVPPSACARVTSRRARSR